MPAPRTDKPRVSLNVDTLDAEGTRSPFVAVHDGKPYTFADPGDLGWQALETAQEEMERGRLRPVLTLALGDQLDGFLALDFPARKMGRVIRDWQRHYGMAENPGEGDASSTS